MKIINKFLGEFKDGIIRRLIKELKWIYIFFKNFIPRIIFYIILVLVHTFVDLIITYKIGNVVDFAIGHDTEKVIKMGMLYVILFLVNAVISIASNRFAAWNYNDMQRSMVKTLFRKIVYADWEELTAYHSGDLITRMSTDARTIAGNANGFLTTIVSEVMTILLSVLLIIYYDATMLLVVVVIAPIIIISSKIFMKKIYDYQSLIRVVESKETAYYKETFHNIQAVKAFGLADLFYQKIEKLEKDRFSADMKSNFFSLMSWAVTYLSGIFSGMICVGWAFYRVNSGAMTFGILSVVVVLAVRIATAGKTLLNLIPVSLQVAVAAERVREVLAIPDEELPSSKEYHKLLEEGRKAGIAVHVENMSFAYKKSRMIFNNVCLEAHPGEAIALVGPSGEGKTTMLRILLGILTAQEGKVYACAEGQEDSQLLFSAETRQLIAYVPQGNTMLSGTIEENMRMIAPDATDEEIIDALEQACAYDFVKKLPKGIYHEIGESGLGFSEGQNQRLAIARAILRKTPILLMDEATSALDVATERKVLANIMKKDGKRTCILTTHRPSVLSACNRVYRIANSQVNVIGDKEIEQLMNEF